MVTARLGLWWSQCPSKAATVVNRILPVLGGKGDPPRITTKNEDGEHLA
jgi:hypothetical protein